MARRIKVRDILRQSSQGLSQNEIVRALHVSKTSVSDTLHAARKKGIGWEDVSGISDQEAYELLFPERASQGPVFEDPDWQHIHAELAKVGVTLKLLHAEYKDERVSQGRPYMSYDRFCKRYRDFTVKNNVVSRVGHKAGRIMEVDWAGPTMRLLDPASGKEQTVYLFVACLPFSRYSYVEPTLDMKQATWLSCHAHAFSFFGGVTATIVPDNLKTGVTSHPKEGEVVLNGAYEDLASYYGTAVLAARVRTPRDKPGAENEVWCATTYVIGALRAITFTDISQLRALVAEKVKEHNAAPFSKRQGSRLECFMEEERATLRPLPEAPYEVAEWVYSRKVQLNCHVSYKRNFYSAPAALVGKSVDLRVTESKVEIFFAGERVATHPVFPAYARNRYSTHEADLPKGKSYSDWDAPRIRRWADRVGPSCREVIDRLFSSYDFDEQAFNGALAILRLSHAYSAARLEDACSMVLRTSKRSPRYRDIEPILKTNQDKLRGLHEPEAADAGAQRAGYVRGADYYERA